jgi:hypothetical protein
MPANKLSRYVVPAILAAGLAGFAANQADASMAVSTESVSLTFTPNQTIDNAFVVLAAFAPPAEDSSGTYLSGTLIYEGATLNANTTYTASESGFNPNDDIYGAVVGLAPAAAGSSSQNVILGLGSTAASNAIANNTPLSSYLSYLTTLVPSTFSYTSSGGTTYTVSGININSTDPKSSVDQILNGTYPANLTISSSGVTLYNAATDVIPYTVTLPIVGTVPVVTPGSSFAFGFNITAADAADFGESAVQDGALGELVNFDSPTNAGSIQLYTVEPVPEPSSIGIFALGAVGGILLLRVKKLKAVW